MDTTNVEQPAAAGQMTARESQWCNAVKQLVENTLSTRVPFRTLLRELYQSLRLLRAHHYDVDVAHAREPGLRVEHCVGATGTYDGVLPNPSPKSASDDQQIPLTELENEFLRDILGLIDFATRNGLNFIRVAGALNHDVGAIVANYGANLQNAVTDCFTPRVTGWAKKNVARSVNQKQKRSDQVGKRNPIMRGEIYNVQLDPCFGSEMGGHKMRPVAVVSIDDIHNNTQIVIVVPGTSTAPRLAYLNVVAVDPDAATNGLLNRTFFQCHQIRSIDQGRITQPSLGRLTKSDYDRLIEAVWTNLGWTP